jgi:putative ABC transport system permease protein
VTAVVAGATGLLFGVAPALLSASPNVTGALKDGLRTVAGGLAWSRHQWPRGGLVLAEVALALILLAGAGLLIRSFALLLAQPPGLDTGNLLTAQVDLPPARYDTPEARRRFWLDLTARLETLPGVVSAGASNALPFSYFEWQTGFQIRGREDVPNGGAGSRTVTAGLFATLGIPLLQGRPFTGDDTATSEPVVIVSDVFAREHLPGVNPIGQQIRFPRAADALWHRVVGVVGATRHLGLTEEPRAEIYRVITQYPDESYVMMAARRQADPASLAPEIERAVHDLDAKLPVLGVMTMDDLVARRMAQRRFYMQLLSLFAGLAAVLAATGIYGVMSFLVTEGRREIGIRVALGAQRAGVIGLVLGQGLRVAAIGCAVGLAGAWWLSSVLEEQVFGITTRDPATLATVAAGLLAVAALACWIPASRSSRVDPAEVMRVE